MDRKQETAINLINKNYNKCLQYAATLASSREEIEKK